MQRTLYFKKCMSGSCSPRSSSADSTSGTSWSYFGLPFVISSGPRWTAPSRAPINPLKTYLPASPTCGFLRSPFLSRSTRRNEVGSTNQPVWSAEPGSAVKCRAVAYGSAVFAGKCTLITFTLVALRGSGKGLLGV